LEGAFAQRGPQRGFDPLWDRAQKLKHWGKYAGASALPGWVFWRLARPMFANPLGYDEQIFVWGGWSILKGLAPYRDFLEWKPPVAFLSHALALKLFGFQGYHFRYFFFALSLASIVALMCSLVSRGIDWVLTSALGVAIVHMLLFPGTHEAFVSDTESMGAAYYYLGIAALMANVRSRRLTQIAGGIFLTCCGLSKEPFIPCVVATWIGCYFVDHSRYSRETAWRYFVNTTLGVVLAFGALALYMAPTGSLSAYVALVREYSTLFRDPQKGYCPTLGMYRPSGKFWKDLPTQWEILHGQFINLPTLGFLAPFVAASLVFLPKRSPALLIAALAAAVLSFYGVTATHCYFMHYYVLGQSGLMYFLVAGLDATRSRRFLDHGATRLWIRSAVLLAMMLTVWPRVQAVSNVPFRDGPPFPEPAPGVFDLIRAKTEATDKIFTTGPPGLYVFMDRLPATRTYSTIDELLPAMPGTTDQEKLRPLAEDLRKNRPKIVFLDPELGHRKLRHMAAAVTPFLEEQKYVKVGEYLYLRP
jgi:hypothetical protein